MTAYWQLYGCTLDPFVNEQTYSNPYLSGRLEQQLDLLFHLASQESMIQVVVGLSGVGKTTMLRLFMTRLKSTASVCKVHGGATLTADILQELLLRHLGILAKPSEEQLPFKEKFIQHMQRMRSKQQNFFLVVDNAHKLPKSSLALLLNLIKWQGTLTHPVHVILFGGPQLEAMIADITLDHMGERLTHTLRLEAFNLEETRQYLEHRLQQAGYTQEFPFSDDELNTIFQFSQGLASKINFQARQLLLQKKSAKQRVKQISQKANSVIKNVLYISIVFVLVIFSVNLYQHFAPKKVVKITRQESSIALKNFPAPTADDTSQAQVSAPALEQAAPVPPEVEQAQPPKQMTLQIQHDIENISLSKVSERKTLATNMQGSNSNVAPKVANEKEKSTTETENLPTAETNATSAAEASSAHIPFAVKNVTPVAKVKAIKKISTAKPKSALTADEAHLLKINKTAYALQLAGASQLGNLQKQYRSLDKTHPVYIFRTTRNGSVWYVAVYGIYPNAQVARQAIAQLPPSWQAAKPWPRAYSNIQQAILTYDKP